MPEITAECAVLLIHIFEDALLNLSTEVWLFSFYFGLSLAFHPVPPANSRIVHQIKPQSLISYFF